MAVEGPRNANGDDPLRPTTTINGWTVTLISKNCKHPERAIAFLDYLMSEHGQLLTYLGVEGVTYDIKDGKPVLRDNIKQILDTDRAAYDREYGADDAYWMLQDNVMQLQWKQEPSPATAQLEEWGRKYVVYNGQYDVVFESGSKEASEEDKITKFSAVSAYPNIDTACRSSGPAPLFPPSVSGCPQKYHSQDNLPLPAV